MKKSLFIIALLVQTIFVFATDKKVAVARYENVKMYQQPGTSTRVLKALKSTDELVLLTHVRQSYPGDGLNRSKEDENSYGFIHGLFVEQFRADNSYRLKCHIG